MQLCLVLKGRLCDLLMLLWFDAIINNAVVVATGVSVVSTLATLITADLSKDMNKISYFSVLFKDVYKKDAQV